MSLIRNERTKLLANALDTGATSCFASSFGLRRQPLTDDHEGHPQRVGAVNEQFVLAFIVTPVALGWIAAILHERCAPRPKRHPAE